MEKQLFNPALHNGDETGSPFVTCRNCSGNGWSNPTTRCPTCGGLGCITNVITYPPHNQTPIKDVNNTYGPGTFGCHEAMHTASLIMEMIDRDLCDHPSIEQNEDWRKLAKNARSIVFDLYQAIGAAHLKDDAKPLRD
jgi:excinuclease UvrABC ATPase subunit